MNLIGRNPADLLDALTFQRKEMLTLDADQLTVFLEETGRTPYGMPIHLAAHTGMRRGEVAGLQWRDIDFDNVLISVVREIVFVPGLGYLIRPPKSAMSRRAIEITSKVAIALQRHRASQAEQRLRIGPAWEDGGWVFTRPDGCYLRSDAISKAFEALREQIAIPPVRPHDMRHTHASLMVQAGVHLTVIQERLRHAMRTSHRGYRRPVRRVSKRC